MPKKGTLLLATLLALSGFHGAMADGENPAVSQVKAFNDARLQLRAGRKEIVRDEIRLGAAEAPAFWSTYEAYRAEVTAIRDRQAESVIAYLQGHRDGSVTAQQAEQLLDDELSVRGDILQVQKKYLRKFRRVLPAWQVTRFYQLESKLDAELDVQLARFVPLMDPI